MQQTTPEIPSESMDALKTRISSYNALTMPYGKWRRCEQKKGNPRTCRWRNSRAPDGALLQSSPCPSRKSSGCDCYVITYVVCAV